MSNGQRVQSGGRLLLMAHGPLLIALFAVSARAADIIPAPIPPRVQENQPMKTSAVVNTIPEGVRVFPNPWRADKDGNSTVTFDHISPASTVKIFTLSGHEVRVLSSDNGSAEWDRTNNAGDKVASGIYLYLVTDGQGNLTKGKLAIIR